MYQSLEGVYNKIIRAEEHLAVIRAEIARHKHKCRIVFKKDVNEQMIRFIADIPEPPPFLSIIIGECLHNLRSALDHIVWHLAEANPPNRGSNKNQFPICDSASKFREQKGRKRLEGVPMQAQAVIERLQPYQFGSSYEFHTLWRLNALVNIDKHRTLMLTTGFMIAKSPYLIPPDGFLAEIVFDDGIYGDGAIIGEASFTEVSNPDKMEMHFERRDVFVSLKDALPIDNQVDVVLEDMIEHVKSGIIPRFEPFFH
jgi:hypothetical protein